MLNEQQAARFEEVRNVKLEAGAHSYGRIDAGACAMEMAAYVAGEKWSDHPQCVDLALGAACRAANDHGPQWVRDAIRDRIPQLIGTRGDSALLIKRADVFTWGAIREIAPYYLKRAGLIEHAKTLREFASSWSKAREVCQTAQSAAEAATAYAAIAAYAVAAVYSASAAYAAAADASQTPAWQMFIEALDRAIAVTY